MSSVCEFPKTSIDDLVEQEFYASDYYYHEVQPGLIVSVFNSSMEDNVETEACFSGGSEYIHFNYLLDGRFEARIKDVNLELNPGDINMGFADGEAFYLSRNQNFYNLEIMITPEVLCQLAGEQLAGINADKKMDFFVRLGKPCQRLVMAAQQLTELIKQGSDKKLLLHATLLGYMYWHLQSHQQKPFSIKLSLHEKNNYWQQKIIFYQI